MRHNPVKRIQANVEYIRSSKNVVDGSRTSSNMSGRMAPLTVPVVSSTCSTYV